MAVVRLEYREAGNRYIGLSSDTKPTDESVLDGSFFEELDTGIVSKWNGSAWVWVESLKGLDHNRSELGRGNSRQVTVKGTVSAGNNRTFHFGPRGIYHHAERRLFKAISGRLEIEIYKGVDPADIPGSPTELPKINQKGLFVDPSTQCIYDDYGEISDAQLTTLLATLADDTIVDTDVLFATPGGFFTSDGNDNSSLPSGRHYEIDEDYLVVLRATNGEDADFLYAYNWHEG